MIAYLTGKIVDRDPTFVIIETNGIGYQINISLHTSVAIKDRESAKLFTHFHVREDAHILYGFSEQVEKKMFQKLIGVNGIGPNTAMVILSCLSIAELQSAIVTGDIAALQVVKGIGKKSAQRIVLELKDRLNKESIGEISEITGTKHNTIHDEALTALVTLGLSKGIAEKSISAALRKSEKTVSLEELVKLALKGA